MLDYLVFGVLIIWIAIKYLENKELREYNDRLKRRNSLLNTIIRQANILGIAPKDLEE